MKQKLIFLDIDGTLLPPGEMTVPASAVEAIRQARANGHKVFLCTGRNLRMTKPLLAYGFDGFVCSAGGYVGCDGKILVDLPMEPAPVSYTHLDVYKRQAVRGRFWRFGKLAQYGGG